ncbi:uncharacterized protein LOC109841977 [Asparagus officinalis]|uniref:uncharacterized protein LOC109841977 n=1 Tax=Asparagus officinalis TaxID=4686 RepID=UPI00098DF65B|nr:uncharacterized protein LOC109841977 [Asparagus officinalis]
MYIKLETTRLDYFRKKQAEIRAELFQGIVDSVAAGEVKAYQVGKRIVLPSLFIGGPRDMRRRYLDVMSLVQRFGKPDFFITMTCNPEWEEITEELHPGQTHNDRPDLTSRIFRAKLQDLKDQLFKKEIFGKVAVHVHVIEFQKRGLPHAHMLIILMGKHKIVSSDHYDKYVSAEIPNQYENPILYELVKKHMMHGPCGELDMKNVCMQNGECKYHYPRESECKYHYPREFSPRSVQAKDAYPIYKRSKNNRTMLVRNKILNNQWVVPYNPYFLIRYNCHINVEICSGIKAVKYLYKYIYKGHDRVAVNIEYNEGENVVNEIKNFQDARWVSVQEAFWRIYEFHLNEIFPVVINLQLHMPNHQYVFYWKHQDLSKLIHLEHVSKTMLTEFFTMCKKIKEGNKKKHEKDHEKELLYVEFPECYVWDSTSKSWSPRKQRQVIGRINRANPIEEERYYLRLLLTHVRCPTSFEDLLTVNGIHYKSFKQSAQKLGLLEYDDSIRECLDEAIVFQMPTSLQRLFASILVHCEPTDVNCLWDQYLDSLSEDFSRKPNATRASVINDTLLNINFYLESMGKDIKKFDLPPLQAKTITEEGSYPREIKEELNVEIPTDDLNAATKLNYEQHTAYTTILTRVEANKSRVFFIDGPGRTGKTYLYRVLLATVRS